MNLIVIALSFCPCFSRRRRLCRCIAEKSGNRECSRHRRSRYHMKFPCAHPPHGRELQVPHIDNSREPPETGEKVQDSVVRTISLYLEWHLEVIRLLRDGLCR